MMSASITSGKRSPRKPIVQPRSMSNQVVRRTTPRINASPGPLTRTTSAMIARYPRSGRSAPQMKVVASSTSAIPSEVRANDVSIARNSLSRIWGNRLKSSVAPQAKPTSNRRRLA
jgi:hypothetical protein